MADDADVAPELEEPDLRAIDAAGTRRRTTAGEYLYRQGDATHDFVTVVSGAVDSVVAGGGGEHRIIRQGARRFLGELNLLSGRHLSVSARVAEDGEAWQTLGRQPLPFETNRPGLFAAGDLRSGSTKRVAAAVGEGSAAVRSVHQCLAFVH